MENLEKALGNRIKTLRKLRGWTQENLAEQAKVSVQHVGEIERGDGNPTLQSLERLSKGLGVTVSQLLAVEEPEQERELLQEQVIDVVKEMLLSVNYPWALTTTILVHAPRLQPSDLRV